MANESWNKIPFQNPLQTNVRQITWANKSRILQGDLHNDQIFISIPIYFQIKTKKFLIW